MDIIALANELNTDPLERGYSGMSDESAAADLNTVYRTRNIEKMEATEVINLIDATEWATVSAENRQVVWNLLHMGEVNPWGVEATLFQNAMAGQTNTLAALAAARVENVSRAEEIGLGWVKVGHVEMARLL